jgi:hypothetical protein
MDKDYIYNLPLLDLLKAIQESDNPEQLRDIWEVITEVKSVYSGLRPIYYLFCCNDYTPASVIEALITIMDYGNKESEHAIRSILTHPSLTEKLLILLYKEVQYSTIKSDLGRIFSNKKTPKWICAIIETKYPDIRVLYPKTIYTIGDARRGKSPPMEISTKRS